MKKIVILFFTFSGIGKGFAQSLQDMIRRDSIEQHIPKTRQPARKDSAAGLVKPSVKLYPNPATNRVEIEVKGFEPGFVQVLITDNSNHPVREEKRLVLGGTEMIVLMFSLKPGIYFLAVKQGRKQVRSKLGIQ